MTCEHEKQRAAKRKSGLSSRPRSRVDSLTLPQHFPSGAFLHPGRGYVPSAFLVSFLQLMTHESSPPQVCGLHSTLGSLVKQGLPTSWGGIRSHSSRCPERLALKRPTLFHVVLELLFSGRLQEPWEARPLAYGPVIQYSTHIYQERDEPRASPLLLLPLPSSSPAYPRPQSPATCDGGPDAHSRGQRAQRHIHCLAARSFSLPCWSSLPPCPAVLIQHLTQSSADYHTYRSAHPALSFVYLSLRIW